MQQPGNGGSVRINVLGPLEVSRCGAPVVLGSAMLRTLLGLLAIQPHRPVSRDEIVDTIWGEHPPRTWAASIHVQIGRLRARLEPEQRHRLISAAPNGSYVFQPRDGELDLAAFDALVSRAGSVAADTERAGSGELALLAEALACWRGRVLDGAGSRLTNHPALIAIADRRVLAALTYAGLALRAGSGHRDRVVTVLRPIARDEPLHEGVHARLMLALAASGQRAAALTLFETVRARLAGDLGVPPSRELRDAHARVLRHDIEHWGRTANGDAVAIQPAAVERAPAAEPVPRPAPSPAQLPAAVPDFTGREETLRQLNDVLARPAERCPGAVPVLALTGSAGVGKTAVAVYWAHRVRDHFPDGQLFVNLRGHAPAPPLRPIDALAQLLRALGVPADRIPLDPDEAASLYRSLLTGKRMLVLLDNAASPDQVRPLLPGGAGCLVLITSRDQLRGLIAREGARQMSLDVLTPREARTLLTRAIGADRARWAHGTVDELARACAYLPLALRIAAANLTGQPHLPTEWFVAQLRTENRLAALEVDGDEQAGVRAALDLSYRALPPAAQRLFRLLGVAPGSDVSTDAAAALGGTTPDQVRRPLGCLIDAHLLSQPVPGRYVMPELLRLFAAERGRAEDAAEESHAAVRRLSDWHLSAVEAAAEWLYPERLRLPTSRSGSTPPVAFESAADALDWLDAEYGNLVATVTHDADQGRPGAQPGCSPTRCADSSRCGCNGSSGSQSRAPGLSAALRDGDLHGQVS